MEILGKVKRRARLGLIFAIPRVEEEEAAVLAQRACCIAAVVLLWHAQAVLLRTHPLGQLESRRVYSSA